MLTFQFYVDFYQSYSVDIANSVHTSYEVINGIYVFTVEQSQRFFLKLSGNEGFGTPDIYKDGQKLTYSRFGMVNVSSVINVTSNSVGIQSVSPQHEGNYKIRSSNGVELDFRLKVTGMEMPQYLIRISISQLLWGENNFKGSILIYIFGLIF